MTDIFPESYIDILKDAYGSPEDIDLYVGGTLETFVTINKVIVGRTLGCVIGENFSKLSKIKFFNHAQNLRRKL